MSGKMSVVPGPQEGLSDGVHLDLGDGGFQQLPRVHGTEPRGGQDWSWRPERGFREPSSAASKSGKTWDYYINLP